MQYLPGLRIRGGLIKFYVFFCYSKIELKRARANSFKKGLRLKFMKMGFFERFNENSFSKFYVRRIQSGIFSTDVLK